MHFLRLHPPNPHHLKSRKATFQGHTVSLFLCPSLELSAECPVDPSTGIVEAKDRDGNIIPPLEPIFHSGLGVSRAGSQAAGPGA